MSNYAGNGNSGFNNGVSADFSWPYGLAISGSGAGGLFVADSNNHRIRIILNLTCPRGYYCPVLSALSPPYGSTNDEVLIPCPSGFFCPAGSAAPTPCPADAPGLLVSAASLAACYINSGGGTVAIPPGAACVSNASCASGSCLGGFCCSATAKAAGCVSCQPGTGSCALFSPGEPCASSADCGTNLCLARCCCALAATQTVGCTACRCWAAGGTNASTAGACAAAAAANGTAPVAATLPCGGDTSVNATVSLSRVISFPAGANVNDAAPLVFLPTTSPLNDGGEDLVIATASACAAYAAVAPAAKCTAARTYVLPTGTYYYLGTAAALGMAATPGCPA